MAYHSHDKTGKRLRFYFYVDGKRSKPLDFKDTITKQTVRDLDELCEDLERANQVGNKVITDKSWETLKGIREGNSKLYGRLVKADVFKAKDEGKLKTTNDILDACVGSNKVNVNISSDKEVISST